MWKPLCEFLLLASLFGGTGSADDPKPIEIPQPVAAKHRISRVNWIRTPGAPPFGGLEVRIQVDKNGVVSSVDVTGSEELRKAAIALAQTWRYRPFEQNGQTVPATFTDVVLILPPELPVNATVPFPVVRDWASVKITLERTRCFGPCPAYQIQIDGSGSVLFSERFPVEKEHRSRISREKVVALVEVFRKANYFSLNPEYHIRATDLPSCLTSISIDGKSMSVNDYGGLQAGMPAAVREVEDAIDEAAGASDWLELKQ